MISHTPKPWKISVKNGIIKIVTSSMQICRMWNSQKGVSQANACLIAAAPDLLEALEDIVNFVLPSDDDVPFTAMLEDARKAIAKAKGEIHE